MPDRSLAAKLFRSDADTEERRQPQVENRGSRNLAIVPTSYSGTARTVEAVLSAGSPVRRFYFIEELEISAQAIDLGRVERGICPLLDTHNQNELAAVIGRISNVRIEAGQLIGTLSFSDTDAGRSVEARVAAGELRAISIGYRVTRWQMTETDDNENETWRAVSWELLEASLVPVPADPNAVVRSSTGTTAHGSHEDDDMRRNLPGGPPTEPAPTPRGRGRGVTEARIREICGRTDDYSRAFERQLLEDHAQEPLSERELLARCQEELVNVRDTAGTIDARAGSRIDGENGAPGLLQARMAGAIYARMSGRAPDEASREFMGASMVDMARGLLEARGERVRWSTPSAIVQRMGQHTTSDFPAVLGNAASRYLIDVVRDYPSPLRVIARQRTANDFRKLTIARLGANPALLLVKENGEIKRGSVAEAKESYGLATYARIFGISRQAIINDDLGAFVDVFNSWGRAGAELEAGLLVGLVDGTGAVMEDGKTLYHVDHGNRETFANTDAATAGGPINVATLSTGRRAIRMQKDIDGVTPLNIAPKYLVVGAAKETEAEQALAQLAAATQGNTNPFSGKLELIVDSRIRGNGWRLFADPAQWPVIEEARLAGQEDIFVDARAGWDVDGVETKARLDIGAAAVDYRGTYYNPGTPQT